MFTKIYHRKVSRVDPRSLRIQVFTRASSTKSESKNPYPFPSTPRPSAHQIFHLPKNASENDIKARYFDLVRIYHPDKADPSIPPEDALATFRSITAAYDSLRGKTSTMSHPFSTTVQESRHPTTAEWRAIRRKREALYAGPDERWKDRVILAGLFATIVILVSQVVITRRQALAEAMAQNKYPKFHREHPQADTNIDTTRLAARDSDT